MTSFRTTLFSSFFFNDTATTTIYTLSLHDALPICWIARRTRTSRSDGVRMIVPTATFGSRDRKSTRLNSSHVEISYAVFCLEKKKDFHIRQIILRLKRAHFQPHGYAL